LIEQAARRWTHERGTYWAAQLGPVQDEVLLSHLLGDLAEQGWLPESLDDWGDSSSAALARLGRAISREVPSAFMPILTHSLGLHLLKVGRRSVATSVLGPIAASPYLDYSRGPSTVVAVPRDGGWVLEGQIYWTVNARAECTLAVVANLAQGGPALFEVNTRQLGCCLGEPLACLGLWGVPACHARLASVRLGAENLVAAGSEARILIDEGYRSLRWGVLSLLFGAIERLHEHALAYAEMRTQGGKRIIEHPPVRQLLDSASSVLESFALLLTHFEQHPGSDYGTLQAMRQARHASDAAFQVFGGVGYVCPGLPERCWRDVRQAATLGSEPVA
jgi:alkylation response protein AidB-like acyl-CoA dehydrogenase